MIEKFDELWEKCENIHKQDSIHENIKDIIDELILKLRLYEGVSTIQDKDIKTLLYGEILYTLTKVSLKDDINIYKALYNKYKKSI